MPGFSLVACWFWRWHRSEHRHLQRGQFGGAAAVAVSRRRPPGADLGDGSEGRHQARRAVRAEFPRLAEQSQSFEEMALLEVGTGTVTGEGEPEQVTGLRVTTNFLSMLGARTVLGRGFTAAEGAGQARYPVAVLTNGYWKRRFGRTRTSSAEPSS
jgi:hypothetical protein